MKKKNEINAIGFANGDDLQKHIKWFKRGALLLDVGFIITLVSVKKILDKQRWYAGKDQQSIDNINIIEQEIIKRNK